MNMEKEPALSIGLITAVVQAAIGLAVALGASISDTLQNAIITFVAAAFPVIMLMALAIRQTVYSPNTVQQIKTESVKAGESGGAAPIVSGS